MSALLSGIYNNRPPHPEHTFIWDVKRVIEFLTTLPYDSDVSLKDLALKLTMLLALTSASTASEIFRKNTKTSKKGKPRDPIKYIPFDTNKNLCVCQHIDFYLEKNKGMV